VPLSIGTSARAFTNSEQFIEHLYPVSISSSVSIDCTVTQDGWRPASLRAMLRERAVLLPRKDLDFIITDCDVQEHYNVKWKVLNRGEEAERRDNIRGGIISSSRPRVRHERTSFRGSHIVERYIIKDGVVVARAAIDVPISANDVQ